MLWNWHGYFACKTQYTETIIIILYFVVDMIFLFIILNEFTFIYGKFYLEFVAAKCGAVVLANHLALWSKRAWLNKFIVVQNHGKIMYQPKRFVFFSVFTRGTTAEVETGLFEFGYFECCDRKSVFKKCWTLVQKNAACWLFDSHRQIRATVESNRIGLDRIELVGNWMNGFIELNWILHGFTKTILSFYCDVGSA